MAASHPPVVVADGEEVVDGHPMLGVDHILGHVQPLGATSIIFREYFKGSSKWNWQFTLVGKSITVSILSLQYLL